MNSNNKRKDNIQDDKSPKRVKKVCSYGESCYRRNPAHFREFSHPHLESILDVYSGTGDYPIPPRLALQRFTIQEQLEVIVEKQLYEPVRSSQGGSSTSNAASKSPKPIDQKLSNTITISNDSSSSTNKNPSNSSFTINKNPSDSSSGTNKNPSDSSSSIHKTPNNPSSSTPSSNSQTSMSKMEKGSSGGLIASSARQREADYRPVVPPTRRAEDYLKVVRPRYQMEIKHAESAPYYIFYTTITDAKETHSQPYSITFQEILDPSLGELRCSLQINFMVEIGWLLAQYYFAGYSEKKLTILYGEDMPDLRTISQKKPHVDAHMVPMATPFGKHHTKMMILCYEDGSLRVVVSTANLYQDDWENRTQGLWFSPKCEELPADAMPHDGESPTGFKKSLLKYLNHYHMPQLSYYVERVKRCNFSHINVFLVASAPGSHFDNEWALNRVATLLKEHSYIPPEENRQWALIAQASSLGSYGKEAKLWLTGDFLHMFTRTKNTSQMMSLSAAPEIKLIYPSLENVRQSHDGLLGGGCLPYAAEAHAKQPWLNNYLYQWQATHTNRNKAMPHIKSYTRISKDAKKTSFYLLTSANVSKAAWGQLNKGNGALRIMSYEAGVLFLPKFVIKEDFFPLDPGHKNRLVIPYDLPPTKYTEGMTPWVMDYLH